MSAGAGGNAYTMSSKRLCDLCFVVDALQSLAIDCHHSVSNGISVTKTQLEELSQTVRERMVFIEFRLWFMGEIRRADISERFSVGPAVSTRDLGQYRKIAPVNIEFEGSGKLYRIAPGFTPIKEAVRLLLDAGANPTLADESGMDALAYANKSGCLETVTLLYEALKRFATPKPSEETSEKIAESFIKKIEPVFPDESALTVVPPKAETPPASIETLSLEDCGEVRAAEPIEDTSLRSEQPVIKAVSDITATYVPNIIALDEEPLEYLFSNGWEAEEEVSAPAGDETVTEAARLVHKAIGRHKVVDRDEDWGGVDLHLPVRATTLTLDEGSRAVKNLLLAALRDGMVSENALSDFCSNADGSRNEEAERLLAFVVGELGATVIEWTGSDEPFMAEPSMEEDRILTEAAEFAEDLASGRNDPFRFYAKDIRGDLLEAEEEIALAREMEAAGQAAISALASWPEGLSAVFAAAARVAAGEADAESFSAGPEPSSDEEPVSRALEASVDEDDESELDEVASFFVNAIAAVEAVQDDARRATEALDEARLTRGFLMELADKAGEDQAGHDFVEALGRQMKARERMILCNLRLALSIAKKHLWSGIPFDDLIQEANIGLMKAVERYDWRKGFRFSTYATWWIRQKVSRSIADTGRVVRAPVHIQETARRVLREHEVAEAQLGRPETEFETARRIGMPLAKTRMLLAMFEDVDSLDIIDPDTGLPRADGLVDAKAADPAEIAENASLRRALFGMLDDLDERSREVILLRFGLMDDEAMTLEEVGQHFGVTRERIRQIESKTMCKLSHRNRREILWPFMEDGYTKLP